MIKAIGIIGVTWLGWGCAILVGQQSVPAGGLSGVLVQGGFAGLSGVLLTLLIVLAKTYRRDVFDVIAKYHEQSRDQCRATTEQTTAIREKRAADESWRKKFDHMHEQTAAMIKGREKDRE